MIVHQVEQNSPKWLQLRCGIPTASDFKKLITSSGRPSTQLKDYAASLAADLIAGEYLDHFTGNKATERGHELEAMARNEYEFISDNETSLVGFITDDHGNYGCSPDFLINEDGVGEIKCQLAKGFVTTIASYNKTGKFPADYYVQVQGQMFVCERDWCDLVLYHPHPNYRTKIIRNEPDLAFQVALKEQIDEVIYERNKIVANYSGEIANG